MNDTEHQHDHTCHYIVGYRAAMADVARRAAALPTARAVLHRCQECQQFMEIGQPALPVEGDAYGNRLWMHQACPPEDAVTAPLVVPDAPMPPEQTARIHSLREALDTELPGAGMAALDPYRAPAAIHTLTTERPDGSTHYVLSSSPELLDQEDEGDEGEPIMKPMTGFGYFLINKYVMGPGEAL